jgi:hypothetical protein
MKALLLVACLCAVPGGDAEKAMQLYREGRFAEAAAEYRAVIDAEGDRPDLQWNLALASWRAGDLPAAETAAEKYAALATSPRTDLHRGLLGAVRFDEAKALEAQADALLSAGQPAPPVPMPGQAGGPSPEQPPDPLPLLEQALAKALQAKDHFVAGGVAAPSPELVRNTERALRYIDELQKKIDELKEQREQSEDENDDNKDDQSNEKKDQEKKDQEKDDPKDGDQKDGEQKSDEQKQDGEGEQQPAEQPPEPQEGEQDQPQQPQEGEQPQDAQPEPKPGQRNDAPGEAAEGRELTPEQAARLLERLKDLDKQLEQIRAGAKSRRPPVEKDW